MTRIPYDKSLRFRNRIFFDSIQPLAEAADGPREDEGAQ
jgi:hypothetical protein